MHSDGMSESQTVEAVHLSKEEQALPFLGEFYGTVQWSVRSIYQGYLGWFDGNPTNLNRLSDRVYAKELLTLIGADRALKRVQEALSSGEYQLALQLSDLLIDGGHFIDDAKQCKKAALLKIAELETSANGRHYYLTCAKEI